MKHLKNINESFGKKTSKIFKSNEICTAMYEVLTLLVNDNYVRAYGLLYDNYDMLYQMFKSDEDAIKLIEKARVAADNKDFYAIYTPVNNIINKLIAANKK